MTKTKRTYKCGGCGELGHNKRTCPQKSATPAATATATVEPSTVEPPVLDPEPTPTTQLPLDGSVDMTVGRRGDTGRPEVPAAPYDCPACERIAVLVLVELQDGNKALRCEHCLNSSPVKTILKWGAFPKDKPEGQQGR